MLRESYVAPPVRLGSPRGASFLNQANLVYVVAVLAVRHFSTSS